MTSTDNGITMYGIPAADLMRLSFDELRDLDDSPAWQQAIDHDEHMARRRPTVTPPCPAWCRLETGHPYEGVDLDNVTFVRFHESRREGTTAVSQEEWNRSGDVTLEPPTVSILDSVHEECTAARARELAAELLSAADLLDRVGQE